MGLRLDRLAPIGVGLIAACLCIWKLMPGVGFWDTAEFQTVPPILGTAHPTGYPTYVILGWLASIVLGPFGEAAFRMNLLSAILVGVAAAITVDLVALLTGSTIIGIGAGLGLATTEIAWTIGTHADPHALHLVLLAGLLWLLVRWELARSAEPDRADRWLIAAAALTGVSVGNHSLTLLLAPPILLYVLAVEPRIFGRARLVAMCVVALVVPAVLIYLELPIRGGAVPGLAAKLIYGHPDTLAGFVYVVTGEQFRGGLNDPFGELPGRVLDLFAIAARQFGPLAALIPPAFIITASRFPAYALLTGTAVFITCFFNAAYVNAEIERYYLGPALMAWTWLAMLAAAVVELVVRAPNPLRFVAATLAGVALLAPTIVAFPVLADRVDRSADRAAQQWLDAVLTEVQPNAIIVSWWSFSTPLWYAQLIEGRRPDIFVADDRTRLDENLGEVNDVIDANLGKRPVYAIRVDTQDEDRLRARYNLTPLQSLDAQNVYLVTPKAGAVVARP
jgi:4-amino-4-deoxy-L-arabinose transferase-like glycosyltransferase